MAEGKGSGAVRRLLVAGLVLQAVACADDMGMDETSGELAVVDVSAMAGDVILGQHCVADDVVVEQSGWPDCTVFVTDPTCTCEGPWHASPSEPARLRMAEEMVSSDQGCLCAVPRLTGQDRAACLSGAPETEFGAGWCYVDQTVAPPVGTEGAVAECPADAGRSFRFGAGGLTADGVDTTVLFVCRR